MKLQSGEFEYKILRFFLLDLIKIESQIPFTTEKAIRDFSIDLSQSFAIGDKPRDCPICEVTECQGKTEFS